MRRRRCPPSIPRQPPPERDPGQAGADREAGRHRPGRELPLGPGEGARPGGRRKRGAACRTSSPRTAWTAASASTCARSKRSSKRSASLSSARIDVTTAASAFPTAPPAPSSIATSSMRGRSAVSAPCWVAHWRADPALVAPADAPLVQECSHRCEPSSNTGAASPLLRAATRLRGCEFRVAAVDEAVAVLVGRRSSRGSWPNARYGNESEANPIHDVAWIRRRHLAPPRPARSRSGWRHPH